MPTITRDEWLAAVESLKSQNKDGLTTQEVADKSGCSVSTAMLRMRKEGWVRVGKRMIEKMSGCLYPCDTYLPPAPSKKKLRNRKADNIA